MLPARERTRRTKLSSGSANWHEPKARVALLVPQTNTLATRVVHRVEHIRVAVPSSTLDTSPEDLPALTSLFVLLPVLLGWICRDKSWKRSNADIIWDDPNDRIARCVSLILGGNFGLQRFIDLLSFSTVAAGSVSNTPRAPTLSSSILVSLIQSSGLSFSTLSTPFSYIRLVISDNYTIFCASLIRSRCC